MDTKKNQGKCSDLTKAKFRSDRRKRDEIRNAAKNGEAVLMPIRCDDHEWLYSQTDDLVSEISSVIDWIKDLQLFGDQTLFYWQAAPGSSKIPRLGTHPLGERLLNLVKFVNPHLAKNKQEHWQMFPRHKIHPMFELFVEQLLKVKEDVWCNISCGKNDYTLRNQFVADLRKKIYSAELQKKEGNFVRVANEAVANLDEYLKGLLPLHSQLSLIQLKLDYGADEKGKAISPPTSQLAEHKKKMLAWLRKQHYLVGYVWKLSHSQGSSYRLHLALFFDTSRVAVDTDTFSNQLALQWQKITADSGSSNQIPYSSKTSGAGTTSHLAVEIVQNDASGLLTMQKLVEKFIYPNFLYQLNIRSEKNNGLIRCFGKRSLPKRVIRV